MREEVVINGGRKEVGQMQTLENVERKKGEKVQKRLYSWTGLVFMRLNKRINKGTSFLNVVTSSCPRFRGVSVGEQAPRGRQGRQLGSRCGSACGRGAGPRHRLHGQPVPSRRRCSGQAQKLVPSSSATARTRRHGSVSSASAQCCGV